MYKNILIPVAPDHAHPLTEALEIARAIAAEGATITALSVVESIPDYVRQYLPENQLHDNAERIMTALEEDIADEEGVQADVIIGHAGKSILEYAEKHGKDCIVIASHRPEFQDYFLGSTAARVVRHAPCAVHVLR
ncbi:MAG: universal stress protein [Sulfitobacter sp.]|nr:universal stress protein [Sulfitobacter sp.]